MSLTKKEIRDLSAMQLAMRLTRLQFNEEADGLMEGDKKEMIKIENELTKRLYVFLAKIN